MLALVPVTDSLTGTLQEILTLPPAPLSEWIQRDSVGVLGYEFAQI